MILEKQGETSVYSDTAELEQEMLAIAKQYPEDLSQDYIAGDNRYTINNTFSSVRRNLLNWYHFRENASVFEIGAGMGALTGCLCDQCANVTAMEMSVKRAEVIRQRYASRTNLEVVCADIFTYETERRFDYVVIVGVLEYAAIFGQEYENPFEEFLKRARNLLKENGIVLLAIENRFGLKYWCGASEDHLCQPFVGIDGYEKEHTPVTFSKAALQKLFSGTGFTKIHFFYVLADYKFPTVIYTDDYVPGASAIQKTAFQYVKGSRLIYNEKKLYEEIKDNHVMDFFANSFLVEASVREELPEQPIYIAAKGECKKEYRVSTLIYADGTVEKRAVHEQAAAHLSAIARHEQELEQRGIRVLKSRLEGQRMIMPYYQGVTAEEHFHKLLQNHDEEGIRRLFDALSKNIQKSSETFLGEMMIDPSAKAQKDYGVILKNGYIDMTLSNCFFEHGELIFFDQEWKFEQVPLKFILFYAARQGYMSYTGKSRITLDRLYQILEIEDHISDFIVLERHLWEIILYRQEHFYDGDGWYQEYSEEISLQSLFHQYERLQHIINEKNAYLLGQEEEVRKKNAYIEKLEEDQKQKNAYFSVLEQELKEKNVYIKRLEKELQEREDDARQLQKELQEKAASVSQSGKKLKIFRMHKRER